jgi:hypothetical protein
MEETITCETVGVKFQSERYIGNKGKEIKRLLPGTLFLGGFPTKLPSIIMTPIKRERLCYIGHPRRIWLLCLLFVMERSRSFIFFIHMFAVCIPAVEIITPNMRYCFSIA